MLNGIEVENDLCYGVGAGDPVVKLQADETDAALWCCTAPTNRQIRREHLVRRVPPAQLAAFRLCTFRWGGSPFDDQGKLPETHEGVLPMQTICESVGGESQADAQVRVMHFGSVVFDV